jgi:very-short-patch-repair endonuclease
VPEQLATRRLLDAMVERDARIRPLTDRVHAARDWRARLDAIRDLYAALKADEIAAGTYCAYDLGLQELFTPIERGLWQSIRTEGLTAVPQYPVGPYFLDFAMPAQKVAIEADGAGYHDQIKDRKRDETLWRVHGWRVFRLAGHECYRVVETPSELRERLRDELGSDPEMSEEWPGLRAYYCTTACGLVRAVKVLLVDRASRHPHQSLMVEALEQHQLAPFRIGVSW